MALEKRISELTAKSGAIEDTDLLVISDYNGTTYDTKKVTGAQIKPFKTYLSSITQSGTSAPTVNYNYSELSGTLTFTRTGVGTYLITNSVAEFIANKTYIFNTNGVGTAIKYFHHQIASTTEIYIYAFNSSGVVADGLLTDNSLEIKIIK
ncbi:hypothetical protein UFOVP622_30 [uncultured Caudovirales phage]|uniref:Uncharacterized protein n=1 Tax=uncultured Caudovirales phage TaxID=2100421 RepID=A0A6J5N3V3_9CAUD|nr:hypothetical protein UFOVP622_30 [uncultured Caudovirales phage]